MRMAPLEFPLPEPLPDGLPEPEPEADGVPDDLGVFELGGVVGPP
jgi:hypothetical protein